MWTFRQILNFSIIWFIAVIALTCIGVGFEKWFMDLEPGQSYLFPKGFGLLCILLAVPITMLIGKSTGWLDETHDK
jgi:hypothetical protein